MSAAVLLYTMRCNIECAHCSVDSHPRRREKMQLDDALRYIRELAEVEGLEFVDISGGEPMLFRRELGELARAAAEAGLILRITSNGYWATSPDRASLVLASFVADGAGSVALSIDDWHLDHLDPRRVEHYVAGCRRVGLQPLLSGVLPVEDGMSNTDPFPARLAVLLRRYGLDPADCVDVYTWADHRRRLPTEQRTAYDRTYAERAVLVAWQPLTAEGRAVNLEVRTQRFAESEPEPCSAAGDLPTIDEAGRLFPCCAPWVSRKEHALADVSSGGTATAVARMRREPLVRVIHTLGPQVIVERLRRDGVAMPERHSGICNQCGMLLDRVPLDKLRDVATEIAMETGLMEAPE